MPKTHDVFAIAIAPKWLMSKIISTPYSYQKGNHFLSFKHGELQDALNCKTWRTGAEALVNFQTAEALAYEKSLKFNTKYIAAIVVFKDAILEK